MKLNNKLLRRLSLFCIIMQSIGIRFFGGFGIMMIIVIIFCNLRYLSRLKISHQIFLLSIIGIIITLCILKGFGIASIINLIATILATCLFLQNYQYKNANFISDIKPILWFFSLYGFVSWCLLVIVPGIFTDIKMNLNYSTLPFIFINLGYNGDSIPRLSSLMWEPGCTQFIINFLLIILISQKEQKSKILFLIFLVLLTRSTTGYINLLIIALLYVKINKINLAKVFIAGIFVFSIGLYSLLSNNITDKVANTSGIIRTRDMYVGYKLTKAYPLFGIDTQNLDKNPEAQALEDEIWGTKSWTNQFGYFAGGFTNGLFGVFLDYGLIIGLMLYWFTLKSPLIWDNRKLINPYCFYAVYFCSLIGEPISRTTLFFMFALSYLIIFQKNSLFHRTVKNINKTSVIDSFPIKRLNHSNKNEVSYI